MKPDGIGNSLGEKQKTVDRSDIDQAISREQARQAETKIRDDLAKGLNVLDSLQRLDEGKNIASLTDSVNWDQIYAAQRGLELLIEAKKNSSPA